MDSKNNLNNNINAKCELSQHQINAVNNIANKELVSIMNKGNEFAQNGNNQKAAAYHSYVQDTLNNTYGIKFTDSESQRACSNNSSFSTSSTSSSGFTNYYGFYWS